MSVRVVLDTNVFLSAVLCGGAVGELVDYWQRRVIIPLLSKPILKEYLRVLAYPKFQLNPDDIRRIVEEELVYFADVVTITHHSTAVRADPSDNKFLDCAVSGQADLLVSGDAHLLALGEYRNIPIVTVVRALARIRAA